MSVGVCSVRADWFKSARIMGMHRSEALFNATFESQLSIKWTEKPSNLLIMSLQGRA
jgi:hypothetical protein